MTHMDELYLVDHGDDGKGERRKLKVSYVEERGRFELGYDDPTLSNWRRVSLSHGHVEELCLDHDISLPTDRYFTWDPRPLRWYGDLWRLFRRHWGKMQTRSPVT